MTQTSSTAPRIPSMIKATFLVDDIVRSSILLRKGAGKCLSSHRLHGFLDDPAAADDFVAAVENRSLARRDRALWLVKDDACALVVERSDRRRRGCVTITHTRFRAHRFFQPRFFYVTKRDPVH